jgi:hypothetical protein
MANFFHSEKQRAFFEELANSGELIFACGPSGIAANLWGLWRVKRVDHTLFRGESMLTFFDGDEKLFRFYRTAGDFSESLKQRIGPLL